MSGQIEEDIAITVSIRPSRADPRSSRRDDGQEHAATVTVNNGELRAKYHYLYVQWSANANFLRS